MPRVQWMRAFKKRRGITYLFRALFDSALVADVGTLTITDTTTKITQASGRAAVASGSASAWSDPQYYSQTQSNEIGLAGYARVVIDATAASNSSIGLSDVITATPAQLMGWLLYFNEHRPYVNGSQIDNGIVYNAVSVAALGAEIPCELLDISRDPGAFWLSRYRSGQYRINWIDDTVTATPLRMRMAHATRVHYEDEVWMSNGLPSVWKDRFGIATSRTATTSNGSTGTMVSDAWVEHKITAATGVTQELMVRRTDDNNCWIVRMDQAGSRLYLYEKVAGVETERGATGGVAQTWTNGTQYRIMVSCDKYNIRVYVGTTYKVGYTAAVNFLTNTNVKVSHAGTELVCWPIRVDLNAGTALKTVTFLPYGDSKTAGQGDSGTLGQNGYPPVLAASIGSHAAEFPYRVGVGGTTVAARAAAVYADIAGRDGAPDYILCNLGINDGTTMGGNQAAWVANYQTIIDTMHTVYPNARIGIARVHNSTGGWDTMDDTAIPLVIAGRSWAFLGPDERVELVPTGTYTTDGIHPNTAGYARMAAAWKTAAGL